MRQPYVQFEVNFTQEEVDSMEKADCGCEHIDREARGRLRHTANCTQHATLVGWGPMPSSAPGRGWYAFSSVFKLLAGKLVWNYMDKLDGAKHDVAIRGRDG